MFIFAFLSVEQLDTLPAKTGAYAAIFQWMFIFGFARIIQEYREKREALKEFRKME